MKYVRNGVCGGACKDSDDNRQTDQEIVRREFLAKNEEEPILNTM